MPKSSYASWRGALSGTRGRREPSIESEEQDTSHQSWEWLDDWLTRETAETIADPFSVPPFMEALGKMITNSQRDVSDPATDALAAGHAQSFVQLDENRIAKLTTAAEATSYRKYSTSMEGAIPRQWDPSDIQDVGMRSKIDALKVNGKGQEVIVMEKLGGNIPKSQRRELDIKIGASTASRTELDEQAYPNAQLKKLKLTIADLVRGSRNPFGDDRGFTLAGCNVHGVAQGFDRNELGFRSRNYLRTALGELPADKRPENLQKILTNLKEIQRITSNSPVTFVASSVFIVIDEKEPKNTAARLIDLAHPVEKSGPRLPDYQKWQRRFQDGLKNLMDEVYAVWSLEKR